MEIGIDIEQNERFKDMEQRKLEKIFAKNEILYAQKFVDSEKHFCAFWCVKEALTKALSNKTLDYKSIEITHTDDGQPYIIINTNLQKFLYKMGYSNIKISLSHSKDYSTAVCLIY